MTSGLLCCIHAPCYLGHLSHGYVQKCRGGDRCPASIPAFWDIWAPGYVPNSRGGERQRITRPVIYDIRASVYVANSRPEDAAPLKARIQAGTQRPLPAPTPPNSRKRKRPPDESGGRTLHSKMPFVGQRRPILPRTYSAVLSALGGLTSGFGMGPGVPPLLWSLTNERHSVFNRARRRALGAAQRDKLRLLGPL